MFTGAAAAAKEQMVGIGGEIVEKKKSMSMLPFQMVASEEGTREEVVMPDYKQIIMFVMDTNLMRRAQMVLTELEKVQLSKLEWYVTPHELMTGNYKTYTSLLAGIFHSNSCLDKSSLKGTSLLQKEIARLSLDQVNDEMNNNGFI